MNPTQTDELHVMTDIRAKRDPGWGVPGIQLHRWPALLAILIAMVLYVTLPGHLYYGPVWLLPAVEAALCVALLAARRMEEGHQWQRGLAIGLIAAMNTANIGSLFLLIHSLLGSALVNGVKITPQHLIVWSAQIWLTNVIVFALWYWELDRGGPVARCLPHHRAPDLLFPQMSNPSAAPPGWTPAFFDYVYTSFTNAAAFSPTDTMPLSQWAKCLFLIQSLASLVTAVLVIARIANILP
ncbi:MAG TPA: hypothetical protein VG815_12575 [Chloroflexota bacterium]|nr:hypothetical protein [Chloroflexota bacterium]